MNWNKIRKEFEDTDISMRALATKNNVSYSTLRNRRKREDWQKKRSPTIVEGAQEVLASTQLEGWEEIFCLEYISSFNQTRSYMKARPNATYDTARVQGSRTFAKPNIQRRISELKGAKSEQLFLDAVDIDRELMKIAFADYKDFISFEIEEVEVTDEFGNVHTEKQEVIRLKDFENVDGAPIKKIVKRNNIIELELHDKQKALQVLYDRSVGNGKTEINVLTQEYIKAKTEAIKGIEKKPDMSLMQTLLNVWTENDDT